MAIAEYISLGRLVAIAVVSIFWGFMVELSMLWNIIKMGPRKYFYKKKRDKRPAVLDDPQLGTHHYARLTNITLHYVSKGQEGRPLVLFLHGFPEMWYSWRFQLKEFGKDYRAVALDMRGYGESGRPQGTAEYRMEKLTGDVKEFIEYLGYKKCYLVAHDWGGAVAWMFATKYPDMVDKLVPCNIPNPLAFQKYMRSHRSQFLKSWYMFFFQLPFLPEILLGANDLASLDGLMTPGKGIRPSNFTEDDLEAFKYTFQNYVDRTGPINYYRAAMRYKPEQLAETHVKCPTMIIWGTADTYLEKDAIEPSKKYVDNECTVCFIEGANHWVQQEEPELVNRHIRDFFSGKKM